MNAVSTSRLRTSKTGGEGTRSRYANKSWWGIVDVFRSSQGPALGTMTSINCPRLERDFHLRWHQAH